MARNRYEIRLLSLFEKDLTEVVEYISCQFGNPIAASRLVDEIKKAIVKRAQNPLAFAPYHSWKPRKHTYYRIYVKNYIIFYVVIDNVMEVRRLVYKRRDIENQI